jgi:hypothetical protein
MAGGLVLMVSLSLVIRFERVDLCDNRALKDDRNMK